jgi:glycosyltransferase involved in cell wall biosynthesis
VGVAIKPLDDPFQQRKSTAKVASYMAAGLPVVCTPSEADRRVIAHGTTGFFASEDHEWHACLRALVTDASLRERIGRAARQDVTERYGADRIATEYLRLFDRLLAPSPPADARLT